jgi:hypothetical protein
MAMQHPDTGVVSLEGDNEIASTGQRSDVATKWVVEIERHVGGVKGLGGCLGDDEEIVAVHVDGVVDARWKISRDMCFWGIGLDMDSG